MCANRAGAPPRGRSACSEHALRLGERLGRPDVEPAARHAPRVNGRPPIEPLDETPGLVGVVPLREVLAYERQDPAWIEVQRDTCERRLRILRLFLERDEAGVRIDADRAQPRHRLQIADVVYRRCGGVALQTEAGEVVQPLREDAVPGG